MGAGQSADTSFGELYTALPDVGRAQVDALAEKADTTLLQPHPAAPDPFPTVPVGVTMRLNHAVAQGALSTVPRLQRKHYEMIPKSLEEPAFFVNFFSHVTVIVKTSAPNLLPPPEPEMWKGTDESHNSFEEVWADLSDDKKAAIAALAARDSDVLLGPSTASPSAFPPLPVGFEIFVDEGAAVSALRLVPGLQAKFYAMTAGSGPKKVPEKDFWVNFFTHATAAL